MHALENDPRHHLPLDWRVRLWAAYGPFSSLAEERDARPSIPQRCRASLFLECVRWGLPRVELTAADEAGVRGAVLLAEEHLGSGGQWQRCRDRVYSLESTIQAFPERGTDDFAAMYLLQAASSALAASSGDCAEFAEGRLDDAVLDRWDAGMYVSWIAAGAAPWDPSTAAQDVLRERYWRWYLQTAAGLSDDNVR